MKDKLVSDDQIQSSIRLSKKLRECVQAACIGTEYTFTSAVDAGLRLWLEEIGRPAHREPGLFGDTRPDERALLLGFLDIIRAGGEMAEMAKSAVRGYRRASRLGAHGKAG